MAKPFGLLFSCLILQGVLLMCATGQETKPNIVILYADDLGYGDLGCYGHPYATTPNIDALANEGLRFTDFYTAAPACSPSRAALLTGRYAVRSGVYPGLFRATSIGGLPRNETTIAEYVKQAGYSTAMVGHWHLGVGLDGQYLPSYQGFDYYLGVPYTHVSCKSYSQCFYPNISCFDSDRDDDRPQGPISRGGPPPRAPCPLYENTRIIEQPANLLTLDDKYVRAATRFIRRKSAKKKPFLLYMAFPHTHVPQYAGERFTDSSIMGRYGDAVNAMDAAVGSIMAAIRKARIAKNTFVFFSSDNGPSLIDEVQSGTPGLLKCGKGSTYEGGFREPGIAWWPKQIKPGKTIEMASTLDLLPTILKLAGVEAREGVTLDGYDMGPILFEGKKSLRDDLYYYPPAPNRTEGVRAVRYQQYKAHFITQGAEHTSDVYPDLDCHFSNPKTVRDPPLLFDLYRDVSETYTLTPADSVYNETMSIISEMKDQFDADIVWGESQIDLGEDPSLAPCANPECTPFPFCCST